MGTQGILGRLRLPLFFCALAAFGPTRLLGFWVNIRCCGSGCWRFRLTATYFFTSAKKSKQKTLAPAFGPRRLGFLRCGTDPGAAAPVCFAAPPSAVYDCVVRSLRSHARINPSTQPSDVACESRSKAVLELALIVLSGEKRVVCFGSVLDSPLTPALSRGRGGRFMWCSKPAFDSVSQVGIFRLNTSVSPLFLRERARVRGS